MLRVYLFQAASLWRYVCTYSCFCVFMRLEYILIIWMSIFEQIITLLLGLILHKFVFKYRLPLTIWAIFFDVIISWIWWYSVFVSSSIVSFVQNIGTMYLQVVSMPLLRYQTIFHQYLNISNCALPSFFCSFFSWIFFLIKTNQQTYIKIEVDSVKRLLNLLVTYIILS